uniref:Uncharacterized protein n=1 Tax=Amphora coffeiformis TaxID=265554 RepID=A0A7S3LEG3_9STRA
MINAGSWSPFRVDLFSEANAMDDVFTVTIREATISADDIVGSMLTGATGSLVWDSSQNTMDAELQDPDTHLSFSGAILEDARVLSSSKIVRDSVTRWSSTMSGGMFEEGADAARTQLLVNMNETTYDYSITVGGTLDRNTKTFIAFIKDSSFFDMNLTGAVLENESEFMGEFSWILNVNKVLQFHWDGQVASTDNNVTTSIKVEETITDFYMIGMDDSLTFFVNHLNDIHVGSTVYRRARSFLLSFVDNFTTLNGHRREIAQAETTSSFVGELGLSLKGDDLLHFDWDNRVVTGENVTIVMDFNETKSEFSVQGGFFTPGVLEFTSFVVEYLILQLRAKRYVDSAGSVTIDLNANVATLHVKDVGHLDFVADVTTSWFSRLPLIGGEFKRFVVSRDSAILFEFTEATFRDEGWIGSLRLLPNDSAKFRIGFELNYVIATDENIFAAQIDELVVGWKDDTLVEIDGQIALATDPVSFEVFFQETASLDAVANLAIRGSFESNSWGCIVDKTFLAVDSKVITDMKGHFRIDFDDPAVEVFLNDSGMIDFETNVASRWFSATDSWGLIVDVIRLQRGSESFMDLSGGFAFKETPSRGYVDFETSPESKLKSSLVRTLRGTTMKKLW